MTIPNPSGIPPSGEQRMITKGIRLPPLWLFLPAVLGAAALPGLAVWILRH